MSELSIQELIEQLGAPLADLKEEAQRSLAARGDKAIAPLVRALGHDGREIRVGAMLTLGTMGATTALPALQLLAESDPDPTLRPMALRAISDLTTPAASDELKVFLIRKLGDEDRFVRALACRALGKIGDSAARRALKLALEDSESWVRDAARGALVLVRAHEAAASAGDRADEGEGAALVRAVDADVAAGLRGLISLDPKVQRRAIESLGTIGDDAAVHVAPLLYDEARSTRRAAIEALGAMGSAPSAGYLVDLLEDDALPDQLRAATLHALSRAPLEAATLEDAARPDLGHADAYVRAAAAVCALHGGSRGKALALKTIVDDDDEWVHVTGFRALQSVASAEDRDHRSILLEALARVVDPVAQGHLLIAMRRIFAPPREGDPPLHGSLSYFLDSEHDLVREAALLLLLETSSESTPALVLRVREALRDDPDRAPEVAALLARLARPGEESPLDLLAQLLRDSEEETVAAAARGLGKIGTLSALKLLLATANEGGVRGRAASEILGARPEDAEVRALQDELGAWRLQVEPRCSGCRVPLEWAEKEECEELRCPECDAEYVLGPDQRPMAVEQAPFGLCLCCARKRLLVRGGRGQTLVCPETNEVHIRPHDTPQQIHLLRDLPLGACSCCHEPQPLIQIDDKVLCRRSRREHVADIEGYSLPAPKVAVATDIDAINEALLGGTLDIGQSGVPVSRGGGEQEEPAGDDEDDGDDEA